MKIGAQLYTVRDFTKNLDDLSETLKKIADIGYKTVQLSSTCEYEPEWMKAQLQSTGLQAPSSHTSTDLIAECPEKVARDQAVYGCKYIGIGWYKIKEQGMDAFYQRFIGAARKMKAAGAQLCYHNHDLEFEKVDGTTLYSQLCERFSPDELKFIIDSFWVQAGGCDPAEFIRNMSGRAPCIHLKDMTYNRRMEAVGEGNMNMGAIIKAAVDTGVEYAFVEQDNCNGENPFDCLARSYAYLKSVGLE